jgi:hypothetical protein
MDGVLPVVVFVTAALVAVHVTERVLCAAGCGFIVTPTSWSQKDATRLQMGQQQQRRRHRHAPCFRNIIRDDITCCHWGLLRTTVCR